MRHRVFINDRGEIETVFDGPMSLSEATTIFEHGYKLALEIAEQGKKTRSLINAKKVGKYDPLILTLAIESFKTPTPGRMAVYGVGPKLKSIVNKIGSMSGLDINMKVFSSREEAQNWLDEV